MVWRDCQFITQIIRRHSFSPLSLQPNLSFGLLNPPRPNYYYSTNPLQFLQFNMLLTSLSTASIRLTLGLPTGKMIHRPKNYTHGSNILGVIFCRICFSTLNDALMTSSLNRQFIFFHSAWRVYVITSRLIRFSLELLSAGFLTQWLKLAVTQVKFWLQIPFLKLRNLW